MQNTLRRHWSLFSFSILLRRLQEFEPPCFSAIEMSGRNLRPGTRKDYEKMANGSDIDSGEETNTEQQLDNLVEFEVNERTEDFVEVSEGELEEMQKRLELLKIQEEKIKRDRRFRRLSAETKKVEKSLSSLDKDDRKNSTKVNMSNLRDMQEVMEETDRQLGKQLGLKKKSKKVGKIKQRSRASSEEEENSSEGESDDSDSYDENNKKNKGKTGKKKGYAVRRGNKKKSKRNRSSDESSSDESCDDESEEDTSCSSSEDEEDKKSSRKKTKHTKKRSSKKKKSGKDEKLTSSVKYPQKWPHAHLGQQFVNKTKKYEDLSLPEFCAGYTSILRKVKDTKKLKSRLEHFENLMYLTTRFQWRSVLSYHAAVLLEIERGNKKWGGDFRDLENTTLAGSYLKKDVNTNNNNASRQQRSQSGRNDSTGLRVLFCRNFQRGTCTHPDDHNGTFEGKSQLLRHICAECWLRTKKMEKHPETSESCPFHQEEER